MKDAQAEATQNLANVIESGINDLVVTIARGEGNVVPPTPPDYSEELADLSSDFGRIGSKLSDVADGLNRIADAIFALRDAQQ